MFNGSQETASRRCEPSVAIHVVIDVITSVEMVPRAAYQVFGIYRFGSIRRRDPPQGVWERVQRVAPGSAHVRILIARRSMGARPNRCGGFELLICNAHHSRNLCFYFAHHRCSS
ncbi:MAG: hypothetical protein IVW54_16270 [Candidatus Binataceae bacterium]|nr:hypothetical protein [Candidatus Binataceae bacterium]